MNELFHEAKRSPDAFAVLVEKALEGGFDEEESILHARAAVKTIAWIFMRTMQANEFMAAAWCEKFPRDP